MMEYIIQKQESRMAKMIALKISLVLLASLLISCSKKKSSTETLVTFEFRGKSSAISIKSNKAFRYEDDPTTVSDYYCFGIFVTYPELPPINQCEKYDNTTQIAARPDAMVGLVAKNAGTAQVSLPVQVGTGRLFQVIAFASPNGYCPNLFTDFEQNKDNLSRGFIVGSAVRDVGYSPMTVNISIDPTISNHIKLGDCSGPMMNWSSSQCPSLAGVPYSDIEFSDVSCNYDYLNDTRVFRLDSVSPGDPFIIFYLTDEGNIGKLMSTDAMRDGRAGVYVEYETYNAAGVIVASAEQSDFVNISGTDDCLDLDTSIASPSTCDSHSDLKLYDNTYPYEVGAPTESSSKWLYVAGSVTPL
jgi:hypothetical protein